jgi:hypothetical protein
MKLVGVAGSSEGQFHFLKILGALFDTSIVKDCSKNDRIDGKIVINAIVPDFLNQEYAENKTLFVMKDSCLVDTSNSNIIKIGKSNIIPSFLWDKDIEIEEARLMKVLTYDGTDIVGILGKDGKIFFGKIKNNKSRHYFHCAKIPELKFGQCLYDVINYRNVISIFPIILFLRSINENDMWIMPPLRATFMFDDPNLHWPSYGFINYNKIAKSAIDHNYHVSIATIPIDSWFTHDKAAEIFRNNNKYLSLIIHGNDHLSKELGREYDNKAQQSLLREAIMRISKIENIANLRVPMIMAPPHGACSEKMLCTMAQVGFEGATISKGSLYKYNSSSKWMESVGFLPADIICGLPIITRFPINKAYRENMLLCAILGQPIVMVGHHTDLKNGIDFLNEIADFANLIIKPIWLDMKGIFRSNFAKKICRETMTVRSYSRIINILVPEGVEEIVLENADIEQRYYAIFSGLNKEVLVNTPIKIKGEKIVTIYQNVIQNEDIKLMKQLSIYPYARRLATELRDRLMPFVSKQRQ